MNFSTFIGAVMDSRNLTIGASVGSELMDVAKDGKITPQELIDAGHEVARVALDTYGAGRHKLVSVHAAERGHVAARLTELIGADIRSKLDDGDLNAGELNDLIHKVGCHLIRELVVGDPDKHIGE